MKTREAAIGSALFFALAPGVVAGVIPWWLTGWDAAEPLPHWAAARVLGAALIVAGVIVLAQAFIRFVREGSGTPAPPAPTDRLVVGGLYRYVRNPMYIAVAATIVGQALVLGRLWLLAYAALFCVVVAAFVRLYEEPALARQFGADYETYRRAVPAWWPRRHAWAGSRRPLMPPQRAHEQVRGRDDHGQQRGRDREQRERQQQDQAGNGQNDQRQYEDAEPCDQVQQLPEHLAAGGLVIAHRPTPGSRTGSSQG